MKISLSSIMRQRAVFNIIFILLCFSIMCNLHATNTHSDSTNKTSQAKQQPKVQIKGDTLVIQDGSCQSHNKTLLSKLNAKDSKQTIVQECDDSENKE